MTKKVIIVGAGIAGLSLARACLNKSLTPIIIEKSKCISSLGAGICLPGNAMLAFRKLGLEQEILKNSRKVNSITYALETGKTLARGLLNESPLNKAAFVALPRPLLLSILAEGLEQYISYDTQICTKSITTDGVSIVTNNNKKIDADILVGADGIQSPLRKRLIDDDITEFPVTYWRFTTDLSDENLEPVYYMGPDSLFMIYPMNKGQAYCYAQVVDKKNIHLNSNNPLKTLRSIFGSYNINVSNALEGMVNETKLQAGKLCATTPLFFESGRTVLIGDALHGCPPTLQQGAALAAEDALSLAHYLAEQDVETAIQSFSNNRKERVEWVVKESNKITRVAGIGKTWVGRALRNYVIKKNGCNNVNAWLQLT